MLRHVSRSGLRRRRRLHRIRALLVQVEQNVARPHAPCYRIFYDCRGCRISRILQKRRFRARICKGLCGIPMWYFCSSFRGRYPCIAPSRYMMRKSALGGSHWETGTLLVTAGLYVSPSFRLVWCSGVRIWRGGFWGIGIPAFNREPHSSQRLKRPTASLGRVSTILAFLRRF